MTLDEISQMPHLGERVHLARQVLEKVQSKYRVVFEDPDEPGTKILIPDPNWLASALAGGVLPDIEAYLKDKRRLAEWQSIAGNAIGGFAWKMLGGARHPYAPPRGPMTEEEAIEYLIMKDVPNRVWEDHSSRNHPRFIVTRVENIPANRAFRNNWLMAMGERSEVPEVEFAANWFLDAQVIEVDMKGARETQRQRIREERSSVFEEVDGEWFKAMETGDAKVISLTVARKRALRDAPQDPRLENAVSPEELNQLTLDKLVK